MLVGFLLTCEAVFADFNPFASDVIDISLNAPYFPAYLPAPGQRVNVTGWNDPCDALGPVSGGGTMTPNNSDVVTLGGFGGQIVLAFDHDVQNCSANPMGLDAIVFTNALWPSGNPQWHWAEFATIEIMPELNGNNIAGDDPDEKWFLIRGSALLNSNDYRISDWQSTDSGYPTTFTDWPDTYQTAAYELFPLYQFAGGSNVVVINPNYEDADPSNDNLEGYFGYAEYTPTLRIGDRDGDNSNTSYGDFNDMSAELFYTTPDDPLTVGILPGSCGGDAFDISWAVDTDTWQPADLTAFRYIRITTAVDQYGSVGEVSAEIDGASDVRPVGDIDGDDDVDFDDFDLFAQAWLAQWGQVEFNPAADLEVDNKIDFADYGLFAWGWEKYNK